MNSAGEMSKLVRMLVSIKYQVLGTGYCSLCSFLCPLCGRGNSAQAELYWSAVCTRQTSESGVKKPW